MIGASVLFEPRRTRLARWGSAAALVVAGHVCAAALAAMNWQDVETEDDSSGTIALELAPMPASPRIETFDAAIGPRVDEAKLTPQPAKEIKEEVEKELPRVEPSPAPEPEVALPMPRPVDEKKPEDQEAQEKVVTQEDATQAEASPLTTAPPPIDAKEAQVAAAPVPGLSTAAVRVQASWLKQLTTHFNRYKRYPAQAQNREIRGEVSVQFTMDRSGKVLASHIVRSSGSALLDEEALALLQRASPLPQPPEQLPGEIFEHVLPIQFRIK
jgi:periplasmic protein TonB